MKFANDEEVRVRDRITAIELLLAYSAGKPKIAMDVTNTFDATGSFLEALKEVNAKAVQQRERNAKLIDAKPVEDAEAIDVPVKKKGRARKPAKQLSSSNGKA